MANNENLIPHGHKFTLEEAKKGGTISGKRRRDKKKISEIVSNVLGDSICKYEAIKNMAEELGLEDDMSVKQLYTIACVINGIRNANVKDLETIQRILGEQTSINVDLTGTGVAILPEISDG